MAKETRPLPCCHPFDFLQHRAVAHMTHVLCVSLRPLPGDKSVVWVSGGCETPVRSLVLMLESRCSLKGSSFACRMPGPARAGAVASEVPLTPLGIRARRVRPGCCRTQGPGRCRPQSGLPPAQPLPGSAVGSARLSPAQGWWEGSGRSSLSCRTQVRIQKWPLVDQNTAVIEVQA